MLLHDVDKGFHNMSSDQKPCYFMMSIRDSTICLRTKNYVTSRCRWIPEHVFRPNTLRKNECIKQACSVVHAKKPCNILIIQKTHMTSNPKHSVNKQLHRGEQRRLRSRIFSGKMHQSIRKNNHFIAQFSIWAKMMFITGFFPKFRGVKTSPTKNGSKLITKTSKFCFGTQAALYWRLLPNFHHNLLGIPSKAGSHPRWALAMLRPMIRLRQLHHSTVEGWKPIVQCSNASPEKTGRVEMFLKRFWRGRGMNFIISGLVVHEPI